LVARNRLISGLCKSVIIVETARDGGAMHAARRAEKQGKKVFALDIPASGNQELLQNGATPLSIHEDYANFLTSS
jgi:DNA processing protein